MPARNEAAHIEQTLAEWYAVAMAVGDAELVVIDDCSTDGTSARLDALSAAMPGLRVLRTDHNAGHGPAIRLGLEASVGNFVFQTDSDRQHTPDDFWLLWNVRDTADFVFGVRTSRADGLHRTVISHLMRVTNFLIWGEWIADANCPFKLMRREPLQDLLGRIPGNAFIPMVMISLLSRRCGYEVRELEVRHFPRTAGQQSMTGVLKWAQVAPRCVKELFAVRVAQRAVARSNRRGAGRLSRLTSGLR
jgi:glycosyltransferase involved in cell wall biosynthesis